MKFSLKTIWIIILFLVGCQSIAQRSFNLSATKSSKIRFQLINNVIVMPVELNGVKLSFVLDTGVSQPILFNLVNIDSLKMRNLQNSYLKGLGNEGAIKSVKSRGNILKIGEAISINEEISVIYDSSIDFTSKLGVPVHGIIGYDLFNEFVVEINYNSKYIRLHRTESFKKNETKKWRKLKIDVIKKKSYLNAEISLNSKKIPVRLLIDTGSSDALWLFENYEKNILKPKDKYFEDFLGKGLSGSVFGSRSKLESLSFANFQFKEINVAFPDSIYLNFVRNAKVRNGSVSGNILKRFNIFLDYSSKTMWLKKNGNFNLPFRYNNSGIVVEQKGYRIVRERSKKPKIDIYSNPQGQGVNSVDVISVYRYVQKPVFEIVELRDNSNAKIKGLRKGDILLFINGKSVGEMSLSQVNKYLYDKKGTQIRIKIERRGSILSYKFKLDDVFKKKSLQIEDSN